ncbi:MAG TPA: D-glucuronyl C5-epimerase family protein [Ktedonobacteraceae bacterium]|nr:D-glucuronyl C5-epimerase family protein [Ktedonobacteraceae bacterium]
MSRWTGKIETKLRLTEARNNAILAQYPVDLAPLMQDKKDTSGFSREKRSIHPVECHPTIVAQHALVHWNQYITNAAESQCSKFLVSANWLIENERRIGKDAGGWPISFPHPTLPGGDSWLSASAQGTAISVLLRAYQLTQKEEFFECAQRVARTFERDILDGGVSVPIGKEGVFFEEVAIYPASHSLSGFIFGLLGLYEYVAVTGDVEVEKLIARGLATMHGLIAEFDAGFWTRFDLLHRDLATPAQLVLQVELLAALARLSGCDHCLRLVARWRRYQHQFGSRLRYQLVSYCRLYSRAIWGRVRDALFPEAQTSSILRVCVPVTAMPVMGGMHSVLAKIARVTSDIWRMEYLAQAVGPNPDGLVIHKFGTAKMAPWQFPAVWLYSLAAARKLCSLMAHGARYDLILTQDGVFTSAFTALLGRLAGVRIVCIDHGNLRLLNSPVYRAERLQTLSEMRWPSRLLRRILFKCYWPSLSILAWLSARFVDHYFIPGVPGDGTEDVLAQLGVQQSRITRFANMIDVDRHVIPDEVARVRSREAYGIAGNAIVIAMICRLAPEKGIDTALEAISLALSSLTPELRGRVRMIIAGDGPLRAEVEEDIRGRQLEQVCLLWGQASQADVISLLGISDIFLYTSRRGAGYPMAILEAMASECAVIATNDPLANEYMLAEGRGIIVPIDDARAVSDALVSLIHNGQLCRLMGSRARSYVAAYHSAITLRRSLLRVTHWSSLDESLQLESVERQ